MSGQDASRVNAYVQEAVLEAARKALASALAALAALETPPPPQAQNELLLLAIPEAAALLGVGRTTAFALVRDGELETVAVPGGGRKVPRAVVDAYVERLRSTGPHRRRAISRQPRRPPRGKQGPADPNS